LRALPFDESCVIGKYVYEQFTKRIEPALRARRLIIYIKPCGTHMYWDMENQIWKHLDSKLTPAGQAIHLLGLGTVGRCRVTVLEPMLRARLVSTLESAI